MNDEDAVTFGVQSEVVVSLEGRVGVRRVGEYKAYGGGVLDLGLPQPRH